MSRLSEQIKAAVNLSLVTTKPIVVSESVNFSSYIKI